MRKFLLLVLLSLFTHVLFNLSPAYALTDTQYGKAQDDYEDSGNVSSPLHVSVVNDSSDFRFSCKAIGLACTNKSENTNTYIKNSAFGQISTGISMLYDAPPARTSQFIAYYGQKIGIVKPAYAQGIGFSGLSPLMKLWQGFRNIAYGFLILVMIIIGFMILFRAKIDPRTVISVQNAIPRIIVTLFLITFSYAIVGLLIDIMYLLMFLGVFALNKMVPFQDGTLNNILTTYTGGNFWDLIGVTFSGGMSGIKGITEAMGGSGTSAITTALMAVAGVLLGGLNTKGFVAALVLGSGGVYAMTQGVNPIVALLVALAILFTSIRIYVMLLNAWISILLSLIFGPLQIMLSAIPNSNSFSSWFRNLIANIVVFPVTAILLMMGTIVSALVNQQTPLWTPPGMSGIRPESVSGIISLGFVFIIPTIAGAIKEALKAKPLIPSGTSSLFSPITSVYGTAMGGVSQVYYLKQMFGKSK